MVSDMLIFQVQSIIHSGKEHATKSFLAQLLRTLLGINLRLLEFEKGRKEALCLSPVENLSIYKSI